ncbi:hypothetical protein KUTeg_009341 [Tegillarca granosa]|uniref:Uncharacterized protein n=1 Tax=Tegillarca granosa TaxID=220873 RepID=A0ABQ9F8K8_TEGGR|nr:hypothetical protein KUTeg_009341 [Tegillarca granosa]
MLQNRINDIKQTCYKEEAIEVTSTSISIFSPLNIANNLTPVVLLHDSVTVTFKILHSAVCSRISKRVFTRCRLKSLRILRAISVLLTIVKLVTYTGILANLFLKVKRKEAVLVTDII